MKYILILLVVLFGQQAFAQTILSSPRKDDSALRIKWFVESIYNKEGFNIYKKESGDWNKLNETPLGVDSPKPTAAMAIDKDLKPMMDIVDSDKKIDGIARFSVLIKASSSGAFAKYIGIQYDDENIKNGESASYKITQIIKGKEKTIGQEKFKMSAYKPTAAPKQVKLLKEDNEIGIFWQAESKRFWGVNVYRSNSKGTAKTLVNKKPLLIVSSEGQEDNTPSKFYTDKNIEPLKSYYYELKAVDFFGDEGENSKELVQASEDKKPPPAPEFMKLERVENNITLTWSIPFQVSLGEVKDMVGYNVYRSLEEDSGYEKINTQILSSSTTSYKDSPKTLGTFYYRVASMDKAGNESYSNMDLVSIMDKEPPLSPSNFKVEGERAKITLSWSANKESDLDGYLVFKKIKGTTDEFTRITTKPLKKTGYIDDLPENASNEFQYKITAIDTNYNFSPFTAIKGAKMPDVTPPNQPFIKTVEMGEKTGKVIWLANLEPDLKGYNLYRSLEKTGKNWKKMNETILTNTAFNDEQLEAQVKYYYRLEAIDEIGNKSTFSNVIMARTRESKVVKAPENVSAKFIKKTKSVQLKWKANSPELLAGAVILKRGASGGFQTASPMLTDSQYSDKDIQSNSSYDYQIRLYYKNGAVAYSTPVNITIP